MLRRPFLLILDAMITAGVRPLCSVAECGRTLLRRKTSRYNRVGAGMKLIERLSPSLSEGLEMMVFRPDHLPFSHSNIRVLNYGSGETVFLVEGRGAGFVMKVGRFSLGKPLEEIIRLAARRSTAYRLITEAYAGPYEFFLPTEFLVVEGPVLGSPAVASIQPLLEETRIDLLRDTSDDELIAWLSRDERVRRQAAVFFERTRIAFDSGEWIVDLLGRENLVLVSRNGEWDLKFCDAEMLPTQWLRENDPAKFARYGNVIERMTRIIGRSFEGHSPQAA